MYELNRTESLKEELIWAYERSAARHVAVRQSLGEPDPFRIQHRAALRRIVGEVIRKRMNRKVGATHVASWVQQNVGPAEREKFRELAETELLSLHEGNYARFTSRVKCQRGRGLHSMKEDVKIFMTFCTWLGT